jgi:predicted transposase/invertase (TIGR01784 family)
MAPEKIDRIMETISPEAKDAFDEFRIKILKEGIEQGREEGIEKIAVNMITKGYADEQIAEITNLSIRRIQDLRQESSF